MVKQRDDVPEPIKKLGAKLKSIFSPFADEDEAELARQRFEKAVFHGHYTVDQFETALDEHRHKMRELGDAIGECIKQFRKHWSRAEKLGPHESKAEQALAKTWFKRIIALEERIDAHLQKFEEKLDVLTAWRQYKIKNDIGAEVNVGEVKEFMAEEFDQFELDGQTFEEEEAEEMADKIRVGAQDTVSEDEQEMFDEFIENLGDSAQTGTSVDRDVEDEEETLDLSSDVDTVGNGHSNDSAGHSDGSEIDEGMQDFLKKQGLK